ncbi:MAG: hypothetical protein HC888_01770 [Candidatus Competibacteraceae bacterium]|nr:hypothetical protein [Candidatus Competibacteraceae bacterium]
MSWYKKSSKNAKDIAEDRSDEFFSARKTAAIWTTKSFEAAIKAGLVTMDMMVDTKEGPQKIKDGDVLCKGDVDGELWPQPENRVREKYEQVDERIRGGPSTPNWEKWKPKGKPIEAVQVKDTEFYAGDMKGKKGDYLLRDPENPSDLWIIDQDIFSKTYSRV